MKKITFDVTYTPEDYYIANKIHTRSYPSIWVVYFLGITSLLAGFTFNLSLNSQFTFILIGVFLLSYEPLYLKYISHKVFAGWGFKPAHIEISDDGIEVSDQNGNNKYKLNEIVKVLNDKKMALLFISKYRFFMIPKSVLNDLEWDELIALKKKG